MRNTDAQTVLDYLNELAHKKFRPIKSNISKIQSRLNEGYTIEDIREVIQVKVLDWKASPKMNKYLRPSTLFNATNFENYINEAETIKQNPEMYRKYFQDKNDNGNSQAASRVISSIEEMGDNPLGW
ncbi:MAG: conserved phage C-terminal domain-containing protein, partial [Flavobacteriales bacterium]